MDDDELLDLAGQVLPWVSTQALIIGNKTLNSIYGTLGCDLFILSQQLSSIVDDEALRKKLVKVLELLSKACSVSHIKFFNALYLI